MGEQADEMRQVLETPMGRISVTDDLMVAQAQERIMLIAKGEAPPLEAEAGEDDEELAEAADEAEAAGETETADDAETASGEEAKEDRGEVEATEEPVDEAEPEAETPAEADTDDNEPESK